MQSKGLSRVFCNTTVQQHQFFGFQLSSVQLSHPYMTTGKPKFRLKLKKVGKTTRTFKNDLNQIPNYYTVEVRNRFKGLDLIDRAPEELIEFREENEKQ